MSGIFCISLDFEKYWGIHDVINWKNKEHELRSVESIVSQMLNIFEKRNIHVSWATVGLLFSSSLDEVQHTTSCLDIHYDNPNYSPYRLSPGELKEIPFEMLSAQNEIKAILATAGQDLASHTFSHYYTLEAGQSSSDFEKDMELMKEAGEKFNHTFKSIVFPRNQVNQDYLELLSHKGYAVYRGNQMSKLWASSPFAKESLSKKGRRVLDAYYNIANTVSVKPSELEAINGMINIPANRFLRPSSGRSILEKQKIKHIKEEMTKAAMNGEIYHLWWHPHNFAKNTDEHFQQLDAIIAHYEKLNSAYGFASLNMLEIGEQKKK